MPGRVAEDKWILYRHTNNLDVMRYIALYLKENQANVSNDALIDLRKRLELMDMYKSRHQNELNDPSTSTFKNKIKQLAFWMFGYQDEIDGVQKFIFSPLGNLFVKHIDNAGDCSKIFLTMLFGLQYEHPNSSTDMSYRLYPFRLIFKLLTDDRLDKRIYEAEYAYLIPFIKNIKQDSYDELVKKILNFRQLSNERKKRIFETNPHLYVNSAYEFQYTVSLFVALGFIKRVDLKETIIGIEHPVTKNNRSGSTTRKIKVRYISIKPNYYSFINILLHSYSPFDNPIDLSSSKTLRKDVVKEVYSFYPNELLHEIGEYDDFMNSIMEIPARIEEYANNEEAGDCYLFEKALTDAFNLFTDVEATKIAHAGTTDIECLFDGREKFDVEAKSTSRKLTAILSNRLRDHRDRVSSKYTIVITPRYVPVVLNDIRGESIVIIRASTLREYLYNNLIFNPRNMQFAEVDEIIRNNLGKDISLLISDLTLRKYAS